MKSPISGRAGGLKNVNRGNALDPGPRPKPPGNVKLDESPVEPGVYPEEIKIESLC